MNRLNELIARFLDFARPSQLELQPQRISAILDRAFDACTMHNSRRAQYTRRAP